MSKQPTKHAIIVLLLCLSTLLLTTQSCTPYDKNNLATQRSQKMQTEFAVQKSSIKNYTSAKENVKMQATRKINKRTKIGFCTNATFTTVSMKIRHKFVNFDWLEVHFGLQFLRD